MMRRVLRLMADEILISRNAQVFPWIGTNATQEGQPADTVAFLSMTDGVGAITAVQSETIRVVYTRDRNRLMRFTRRKFTGLRMNRSTSLNLRTASKRLTCGTLTGRHGCGLMNGAGHQNAQSRAP